MNKNYLPLLSGWLKSIRKHNPLVDIAIIIPNDLTINNDEFKDAIFLRTNSFDYVYSSKYIITEFEIFNNYTDFLYLDLDIICTKPLDHIFAKIAEYPEKIHTRTEDFCLNSTSTFHKFSKDTVVDNDLRAFNAGSFGFNHSFKEEMRQFLSFINDNKNRAICDQPLFNMFFSVNRKTMPSLDNYVWLDGWPYHTLPREDFSCTHFVGYYGDISTKIRKIGNYG